MAKLATLNLRNLLSTAPTVCTVLLLHSGRVIPLAWRKTLPTMSSVWRPGKNPPLLPKLHLSEDGLALFNYISHLYDQPVAAHFQSQVNSIQPNEKTIFFSNPLETITNNQASSQGFGKNILKKLI